jgi:tetratricopeptide (TPR) repeat protein
MTGNRLLNAVRELTRCQYIDITLEPLDENESMLLIENLLNIKGFPHSLREQIRARAGGNPFFIEEVIRSFIDQGILTLRNGNFDITDKVSDAEIPLTINEVIMSRIDRLDRETKDLLKIASVIGRSFFYKIITAVAQNIHDIDMQLGHLKEIQLIRERRRMDELEYLFKHALTQETAYNSLLIQKRREIHLHVAQAIEQLFSERLQEFYGMLAWHYNLGDNSDKTEYYLIRAGEESLKASASSEAIYFYKQALGLYRKKYGERADPEKIAMLEKNIGIALFNKGLYEECIEYMDRSLAHYGELIPHHPVAVFRKTVRDLLLLILRLYVPAFRWKYKPTDNDREVLNLLYKKCQALTVTDPASFFIHGIYLSRRLFGVDISRLDDDIGAGLVPSGSALFSYTGISFSLCRKIIRLVTGKIDMNNQRSVLAYNFAALLENTMSGRAPYTGDYDNDLVDRNIVTGEFFFLSSFFYWLSASCIERGDFSIIDTVRDKYSVMNNEYGNVFAGVNKFNMYAYYLMKTRNISEGLREADEGIAYVSDKPEFSLWIFYLNSLKSIMYIHHGDIKAAKESLLKAAPLAPQAKTLPVAYCAYMLAVFLYDLHLVEDTMEKNGGKSTWRLRSRAHRSGKRALKASNKLSLIKTETMKLLGILYWIKGNQYNALKWWKRAIKTGEHLNGRLELSRVYFEIAKRILEKQYTTGNERRTNNIRSMANKTLGMSPEDCLNKAETMFREMDLHRDLEHVSKIRALLQT